MFTPETYIMLYAKIFQIDDRKIQIDQIDDRQTDIDRIDTERETERER